MSRFGIINEVNKAGAFGLVFLPQALPTGRTDLPVSAADSISRGAF